MEKQKVSFFVIRESRRLAVDTQTDAAIAAGFDPERFINLDKVDVSDLIGLGETPAALRRGNRLGVYRYEFLVPIAKKGDRSARALLKKITFRLLELGVVVEEIETGRSCKDENGVLKIYADAVDRLAGARKHDSPGRPKVHDYSSEDLTLIEATWHRKELKNPKERAAAVRALLDDEGKPKYPRFKVATWYDLRGKGLVK